MRRITAIATVFLFILSLTACEVAKRGTDSFTTEINGTLYTMDAVLRSDELILQSLMGSGHSARQEGDDEILPPTISKQGVSGSIQGFCGTIQLYELAIRGEPGQFTFTYAGETTGDLLLAAAEISTGELLCAIPLESGTEVTVELPIGFTSIALMGDDATGTLNAAFTCSEHIKVTTH